MPGKLSIYGDYLFWFLLLFLFSEGVAVTGDTVKIFPEVPGWIRTGESKNYTAENLYEYIDGAAELYLAYDFQELQVAEYENSKQSTVIVEIYRHGSPDQAFGIYSQERPGQGNYLSVGAQGYQEGPMLNFISGNYYIKISADDAVESAGEVVILFARKISRQIGGAPELPVELGCFPVTGMKLYSQKYINRNFLGYEFLHSAFVTDYERDQQEYTLFIIRGNDRLDCRRMIAMLQQKNGKDSSDLKEGDYRYRDQYLGYIQLEWYHNYIWGSIGLKDENSQVNQLGELGKQVRVKLVKP